MAQMKLNPDGVPKVAPLGTVTAAGSAYTDATLITAAPFVTASAADGVKGVMLPSASVKDYAGASLKVYNSGTKSLRVYPYTGGTINGAAANVPVEVPPKATAEFNCTALNTWTGRSSGSAGNARVSVGAATVTAAGSTVADGGALTLDGYQTVTGADGTKGAVLPTVGAGDKGILIHVRNVTAAILKIYAASGGAINGGSANAAVSIAASAFCTLVCTGADTWDAWETPVA